MLRRGDWRGQAGDTLIEVTFALAILGFVLLGATATAASAFRMGQTARERTAVAQVAQEQMEALRSFRDNHTWAEFETGVDTAAHGICTADGSARCFHMVQSNPGCTSGPTCNEWIPAAGNLTAPDPTGTLTVPTSEVEIARVVNVATEPCAMDFQVHYEFTPLGGGTNDSNQFLTRLVNLRYAVPLGGSSVCPSP
jgi:type II secretory pathway pseudopilin PulG